MVDREHNRPRQRVVHLSEETLEFAVNNCDTNIRVGLTLLQTVTTRRTGEKVVDMIENFKMLRKALREAE